MPKMKSVRGAVKRFKAGKNKIKRGSAFRSHILTKMSKYGCETPYFDEDVSTQEEFARGPIRRFYERICG